MAVTATRHEPAPFPARDGGPAPYAGRATATRAGLAGVIGAVAVIPELVDKHRHAAKRLSGQIIGGALFWLLVSAAIVGALLGVAWLVRELRARGHTRLTSEPASWLVCLAFGVAISGALYAHRSHFRYAEVGPRITAAILLALAFALTLRLLLALATLLLRGDSARDPFGA